MAERHGGARPGAGRPKGSKATNRSQRAAAARLREKLARLARSEDARLFALDWLREAEPEVLRRALDHPDWKFLFAVWREMRLRAFGSPTQTLSIEAGPSPLAVLQDILRERRARAALPAPPIEAHTVLPAEDDRPS